MVRRSWRNFDATLLGGLLLLSAFGVVMIYSATRNTMGIGNPVQRQIIYILVGTALLLLVASVDYRLLHVLQHPVPVLTPVVVVLITAVLLVAARSGQAPGVEARSLWAGLAAQRLALALGILLAGVVYVADRKWLSKLDTLLMRLVVLLVVGAMAAGLYLLGLRASGSVMTLKPYYAVAAIGVVYLLDCVTLRFADMLRNPLYVFVLVLLGLTLLFGRVAGGAQSWLGAGAVQPSELAKIVVVVVLAKFLADREQQLEQFSTVAISLGIAALPMLLVYLQPDLGTALTLVPVWLAMVWVAGIRFRHLAVLVAGGVAALPVVWFGLHDYMRRRLLLFLDPASDPDSYFNVHQALVSIGSGGWLGKGLTHGTQSQLHFLRVRHTDFVFAVTAEELGFVGAVAMLALTVLILWRMLRVAQQSRDTLGRLLAAGVAALILFQSVVNVGMNLGLLPVTGIPLPFVSYGGSSLVTLMLGVGLVESVAMRQRALEFD